MNQARLLLLFATATVLSACEPERAQIVIVTDTNFPVPAGLNAVKFEAFRDDAPEEGQEVTTPLGGELSPALPLTLALNLKPGADEGPFTIVVSGYRATDGTSFGEPVVRRKARVSFQPGRVMSLDMHLVLNCAGEAYRICEDGGQTCTEDGCRDLDDVVLEPWKPEVGGLPEGGTDAGTDGHADGGGGGAPELDASAGDGSGGDPEGGASDGGAEPPADSGTFATADAGDEPSGDGGEPLEDYPEQLALGDQFSCVRTRLGRVYCWGMNDLGQLGDDRASHEQCQEGDCSPQPVQVALTDEVSQLAAGGNRACVVHEPDANFPGNLKCWGDLDFAPKSVKASTGENVNDARTVSVGGSHACYFSATREALCWDNNIYGQVGNGAAELGPGPINPQRVSTSDALLEELQVEPQAILCGEDHTCMLAGGTLLCFGDSAYGQCGISNEFQAGAVHVEITGVSSYATGGGHTCAVVGGAVQCWGDNSGGQLGHEASMGVCQFRACSWQPAPMDHTFASPVRSVTAGDLFTCALLQNGRVFCWGENDAAQLGPNITADFSATPGEVLSGAEQVVAGRSHACAILAANHEVRCWGSNESGQLGPNSSPGQRSATPLRVPIPE